MKKKIFLSVLAFTAAVFCALSLSSCGIFGKTESGTAPKILSVAVQKSADGYLTSKEYLFGKETTCPMALDDGESFYVIIKYDNPDKKSISYVKINGTKYNSAKFAAGSDTSTTYVEFTVEDNADSGERQYIINSVYYVNGSETSKMSWADTAPDDANTVSVAIRPSFKVTLDYQNADYRGATAKADTIDASRTNVYYNSAMSYILVSPDFSGDSILPEKAGGWVFTGWYTQPNGKGDLVTADDTYYFWCDMTFYANYERMYNLTVTELDTPVTYTYNTVKKEYTSGVIATNKSFKDNEVTHYPNLTLTDTAVIETSTVTTTFDSQNVPRYSVSVTYSEYPIVGIGNEAFQSFSTLETVSVGKFVKEIGYCAFQNDKKLTSFDFAGDSLLTDIGDYAFESTSALGVSQPFTLPSGVEYLGNFAFRYSGWTYVRNGGATSGGESVLHVKKTWKYIGYKCFFDTGFAAVIFEPGCYFSGQISSADGSALESAGGYSSIQSGKNLIGASLFACCTKLASVEFQCEKEGDGTVTAPALNIIPDKCFDLFSWTSKSAKISTLIFNEGLKYIGYQAFYYQQSVKSLDFPKSLEEVDREAFYENEKVESMSFGGDESQLKILHSSCFGNLVSLDSCKITSAVFSKYGSGVFRGCDRLKCVIFTNLEEVPQGYLENEREDANGNDLEVIVGHYQADFLYATGEAGDSGAGDGTTYSSPLRVFCKSSIVEAFKTELKDGKEMHAGSTSSGTSSFNNSVFVHPLENLREGYTYTYDGKTYTVTVAFQEIYQATSTTSGTTATQNLIGYSLVYWSERSEYMILPTANDLNLSKEMTEIAMYSIPTSAKEVRIPSSYTRIEHDAFNGCTQLTKIEFDDINTLEYIGSYAFFGTQIDSFTGGENLTVIGQYAFRKCTSLEWVDISKSAIMNPYKGRNKYIYQYKYTYELDENDGKDYIDCLGYGAFQGCSSLEWIHLPSKIVQLCTATFTGCGNLVTVIIPTPTISGHTSATDDDCFYEYGTPSSVYESSTQYKLRIYVNSSAEQTHQTIYPEAVYGLLNSAPDQYGKTGTLYNE